MLSLIVTDGWIAQSLEHGNNNLRVAGSSLSTAVHYSHHVIFGGHCVPGPCLFA